MSSSTTAPLKVVIAVDGSANSENAFNWYMNFCHKPEYEVLFYHSHEPPALSTFHWSEGIKIPADHWTEALSAGIGEVKKIEDHYVLTCQGFNPKVKHKFFSENSNKPGEAICSFAKKQGADLIVIGTRGLGTIRRTILGSVSDFVLHHSDCPVSVIPMKNTAVSK